jgi:4-phosphopantoate--beta-alanine ligase
MTRIPRSHPRYRSLVTRAYLAREMERGLLVPEGLIAHGRGEAFDYLYGERSPPFALEAERAAATRLLRSRLPVVSVNGNVAALAAQEVAQLARAIPGLRVEVNLFHRTPERAELVRAKLAEAGVTQILGVHPTARIRGLASDRGWVDKEGILQADTVLVPLEDGDRAEALAKAGKYVITVDLNPFSRSTLAAHLPIVDELTRALARIRREALRLRKGGGKIAEGPAVDGDQLRRESVEFLVRRLTAIARKTPVGTRGP